MNKGNRVAAIVGAYGSGKTSLLESILYTTGAILSKGTATEKSRFADFSICNYEHGLRESVTINTTIANTSFLGEKWTFIDCPGYSEFMQETYNALMIADVAIVVCEPDPKKAVYIHHVMKFLETHKIPRLIFINKIDTMKISIKDILNALQSNSEAVLALREVPMQDDDGEVVGFVDLISERAYKYGEAEYKDNKSLHLKKVPENMVDSKSDAREHLLESLAEYNDTLLEMFLEDKKPTRENIYNVLKDAMNRGDAVPVFFGIADSDEGIFRLLKALRHDVGDIKDYTLRNAIESRDAFFKTFKTSYDNEVGSIYYARILNSGMKENKKIGSFYTVNGSLINKAAKIENGDIIAVSSKTSLKIGAVYDEKGNISGESFVMPMGVMQAVMLSGYSINEEPLLLKVLEGIRASDISMKFDYLKDRNLYLIWGQGEEHIKCILSLIKKFTALNLSVFPAKFPLQKTIAGNVSEHIDHNQKDMAGHPMTASFDYAVKSNGTASVNINVNGDVPKEVKKALTDGFKEMASSLGVYGFDITVTVDNYNKTESSPDVYKTAAYKTVNQIVETNTVEIETALQLKLTLLTDSLGALDKILNLHKGRVIEYSSKNGWKDYTLAVISVPKSEIYDFRNDLKAISYGQAYFRIVQ